MTMEFSTIASVLPTTQALSDVEVLWRHISAKPVIHPHEIERIGKDNPTFQAEGHLRIFRDSGAMPTLLFVVKSGKAG
jgi:hypothetical protein